MSTFRIPAYGPYDKSFEIKGPLPLIIDNDDVPTDQVALLAQHVVAILNDNWRPLYAWFCENEDCADCWTALASEQTDYGDCPTCSCALKMEEISL